MQWTLTLRYASEPQRPVSAWFVPGEDVHAWLEALAQLPLDAQHARLAIAPRQHSDRRPHGALIVGPLRQSAATDHVPALFQPYGCIAKRLYLPVEAVISPPVEHGELDELLLEDQLYVWHPVSGLTASAVGDLLTPAELLTGPPETSIDWNCATPGSGYNRRLLSLSASVSLTMEQMLAVAQGDIGGQADHLDLLPASPREARSGLRAGIARSITSSLARFVLWSTGGFAGQPATGGMANRRRWGITLCVLMSIALLVVAWTLYQNWIQPYGGGGMAGRNAPAPTTHLDPPLPNAPRPRISGPLPAPAPVHDAGVAILVGAVALIAIVAALWFWIRRRPSSRSRTKEAARPNPRTSEVGWATKLRTWAASQLHGVSRSLDAARHRELERLLTLLDGNPDEGLRYALPMTADAQRGIGTPGARLTSRTVDYRGGAAHGSGAADVWDVHQEYRRKLTLRYRELANREIELGRHHRAAYILAELLGDWGAAARTLRDGGHFREAAVVYEERLRQPLEAAQCLERGGLVAEAIVIYQRLKMYETLGDLYAKLEQPEDSDRAYRAAVHEKQNAHDRLGAAQLLEQKLQVPEEAWEEIAGGWPHSAQAEKCLSEAFAWTDRHNDSDRARKHLQRIAEIARSPQQIAQLVTKTSDLATHYPEPTVRKAAAAVTLDVASPRLPNATGVELEALTTALRQLAPEDRLLARDCHRYAHERTRATLPRAPAKVDSKALELRLQLAFPFDNIRSCAASRDTIYAAAWRNRHLLVARGNWLGQFNELDGAPWPFPQSNQDTPILLAIGPIEETALSVHAVGQEPVGRWRIFPHIDAFRRSVVAGDFSGCQASTVAMIGTAAGFISVDLSSSLIIRSYGLDKTTVRLIDTQEITDTDFTTRVPIPFQEREGICYFGMHDRLCCARHDKLIELHTFRDEIMHLVASRSHSRPRLIAVFAQGAEVIWGVTPNSPTTRFADDLVEPRVLLHPNGFVVAADRRRCEVYRVDGNVLRLHAATEIEGLGEAVAIFPAPLGNLFALCDTSGHVRQFHIPYID